MNLAEFKAWFEGYTEGMRDTPSAKQWARIKARADEIAAQPTEVRYFYDHYWRPHYYSLSAAGVLTQTRTENANNAGWAANAASSYGASIQNVDPTVIDFSSLDAFRMLGQADASSEAA